MAQETEDETDPSIPCISDAILHSYIYLLLSSWVFLWKSLKGILKENGSLCRSGEWREASQDLILEELTLSVEKLMETGGIKKLRPRFNWYSQLSRHEVLRTVAQPLCREYVKGMKKIYLPLWIMSGFDQPSRLSDLILYKLMSKQLLIID